ncbi:hypothetical protein [Candidatus Magnetaquiglobus chichijimensis]|uniref:hypothetical protein n=1 Tax=Candidatus Magnetaquiglobus chichijimensis TaxID=3141448 RepID=UPI003B96FFD4
MSYLVNHDIPYSINGQVREGEGIPDFFAGMACIKCIANSKIIAHHLGYWQGKKDD